MHAWARGRAAPRYIHPSVDIDRLPRDLVLMKKDRRHGLRSSYAQKVHPRSLTSSFTHENSPFDDFTFNMSLRALRPLFKIGPCPQLLATVSREVQKIPSRINLCAAFVLRRWRRMGHKSGLDRGGGKRPPQKRGGKKEKDRKRDETKRRKTYRALSEA